MVAVKSVKTCKSCRFCVVFLDMCPVAIGRGEGSAYVLLRKWAGSAFERDLRNRVFVPVIISLFYRNHLGPISWKLTTVKWRQSSQSNRHSTIGARQTECHEALTSSANDEVRCDCTFTDDANASWYSVCRVPMVWRLNCEDCRHLTVVGLHDTGPWWKGPKYGF